MDSRQITLQDKAKDEAPLDGRAAYERALEEELDGALTGQELYALSSYGGKEVWGTETDLDENAYGAAAVAIVKDCTNLYRQLRDKIPWAGLSLTLSRLGFCLGTMLVNLVFQGVILWYIYIFVVLPSVRHVQTLYADFHSANFDQDGKIDEAAWAHYPLKADVCQITMSSHIFYFGILALWSLQMMIELRSCQRVILDIWGVKRVESIDQMLDYVASHSFEFGGRCLIVGLTPTIRAAVLLVVCLPRVIFGICLYVLGCEWLSSSASFADMTLNAMALEFVKNIDEILFVSVLPPMLQREIRETNIFKVEGKKKLKDVNKIEWLGYKRTLAWTASMFTFLWFYGSMIQNVLPFDLSELNSLCGEQIQLSQTPLCEAPTWAGMSVPCFPYGGHSEG